MKNNISDKVGGRPPKNRMDKQHRVVSTKLTELQYYAIRRRASESGVPMSDYIRQAAIRGKIIPRLNKNDADVIRQLAGEANNLNQLAHKANACGFPFVVEELTALKMKIIDIINQLSDDWKNYQRKWI